MENAKQKRREGGRSGNTRRRTKYLIEQMPWRLPINMDDPIEPLSDEGVLAIHEGAMQILEEIGIEILNKDALSILKLAGCEVKGENVRMDRAFVMEIIKRAPSQNGKYGGIFSCRFETVVFTHYISK